MTRFQRFQTGHIYEASGSFFVRFYVTEIVDGVEKRVQRSHRLCLKDADHRSRTSNAVRRLAAEHMAEVNAQVTPVTNQTVSDFWERVYLPFITENKKFSTVHGYKQIWNQHLKNHFGETLLKDYRTPSGQREREFRQPSRRWAVGTAQEGFFGGSCGDHTGFGWPRIWGVPLAFARFRLSHRFPCRTALRQWGWRCQYRNYLSDGITESLIDSLAHVPQLKVKSRHSVFRYKGKDVDVQKC